MSKSKLELLAQPVLSGGEAYALARLLGYHAINQQRVSALCREADRHGIEAEKRGSEWYIDRASWVAYLKKPRRRGPRKTRKA